MHSDASMQMISKKDLNSAELETVTTSRSPTTVITANGEVQTNESTIKNHISFKMVSEYSATRTMSYQSWFLVYQRVLPQACPLQHPRHIQRKLIIQITLQQSCQAKVWIDKYRETRFLLKHQKSCCMNQPKFQNQRKKNHEQVRGDRYYSDISEWLQEFRQNLVDERVPENKDSHASSSHEPSLEPTRMDLGKHSV